MSAAPIENTEEPLQPNAVARATDVFPQPGGPIRRTPLGLDSPRRAKADGFSRGPSTACPHEQAMKEANIKSRERSLCINTMRNNMKKASTTEKECTGTAKVLFLTCILCSQPACRSR